jgi:hypothetical protein
VDISLIPLLPFSGSPPPNIPDPETSASIKDAKLRRHNLLNQLLADDIRARRLYAAATFVLVVLWILGIFLILMLQGFLGHGGQVVSGQIFDLKYTITKQSIFSLSDGVIIATIGGTTASIIGIFMVVMKNLFPKR